MTPIIEAEEIEYTFTFRPSIFATKNTFHLGPLSFKLYEGETIAIIGNNGSGKSLIAKTLVGAVTPHKGKVALLGSYENHTDKATRTKAIRMIFQHNQSIMNPALSVGSILHLPLSLNTSLGYSARRTKIEQTLLQVGLLPEHYHFYRDMMSDGQQQRVAMARALILDPKIIVADEPFAALDPSVRSQTVNLILQLQKDLGLGFIFISHNLGIVRHISDKVMVMDQGQLVEHGDTQEVFKNPQHPLTSKLVDAHFNLVSKHFETS
ncbi:MAG: ATP-binding cassette domain-containing protein [Pseudomonadota bacterium]